MFPAGAGAAQPFGNFLGEQVTMLEAALLRLAFGMQVNPTGALGSLGVAQP